MRRCGVKLIEDRRTLYPDDGSYRSVVVAVRCIGDPLNDDQLSRLKGFFTPADDGQIERWIAELSVIAARRADDDMSEALRLRAYRDRLAGYPADIVKDVLLRQTWKFFPTWAELHEKLESAMVRRRSILRAAENAEPAKPAPKAINYDPPPSTEERGPLPYRPDPTPPAHTVASLKAEIAELEADKDLLATEQGQSYMQGLIRQLAQLSPPTVATTKPSKEAV